MILKTNLKTSLSKQLKRTESKFTSYYRHADYHAIPSIPTNECFYPIDKAKELLKDMKINNINDNSRFILGSCNPILLVPGMYGSRLMINIKCKEFLQDKQKVFETRYFCGKKICQPSFFKEDEEEYVMWPALFDSPFKLYEDEENRKNSCFGYFMQYYNSPDECPKMDIKPDSTIDNEKYICRYHPAVKITYHGSTHKTESNSNCGLRGIENIVDSGKSYIKDQWVNQGSSVGFDGIRNRLQEMGYRAGFSLAGLPYDFRRFIHSNKEFSNNFKNLVESLYNNTGKKVIVIAHSFGALNSLNQLVEIQNTNLSSKIKRFVAIAPPFTGAPKAVQTITLGTRDFRTEIAGLIIDLNKYAQKLFSTTTPASYELMIKPHLDMLQEKTEYVKFTSAILERIKIERTCINETCENEYISKNSKYFNELFDFFPKLDEKLCSDDLTDPKHKELEEYTIRNSNNIRNLLPIYNKCKFRMFDYQNCPVVVYSDNHYKDIENFNSFCNNDKYSEKQYFVKNCLKRNKNNKNRCLLEFMMNEGSFGYENIDITGIYETREIHMKNIEKFYENQMKNDQISTFPNPGVPTTLVYSTFIQTPSAFLFEKNNSNFDFNSTNIHNYGGDGSVPSISVLFPGLKWAYEKGRG